MRSLRSDEVFCLNAVATSIGGTWMPGEDPPDAYLNIGSKTIAIEVSTLTQHVPGKDKRSKPRLSDDIPVVRLCDEIDKTVGGSVPEGKIVQLILTSPILNLRKFKARLYIALNQLLNQDDIGGIAEERNILGNVVKIKVLSHSAPNGKKISCVISHEKSDSNILGNAARILRQCILKKASQYSSIAGSHAVWLILFNDYWLADVDTYRQAMNQLSIEHPFRRIVLVSGNETVQDIYCD